MTLIDCLKFPGTRLTETGCAKYALANPEKCAGCQRNANEKPLPGVCVKCKRPRKIIAKGECKACYNQRYAQKQNARQKEVRAARLSSQVVLHITVSPADAGALLQFITGLKTLTGGAA